MSQPHKSPTGINSSKLNKPPNSITSNSSKVNVLESSLADKVSTLSAIDKIVNDLKPGGNSLFQTQVKNILSLLCSQFTELKQEVIELKSCISGCRVACNDATVSAEKVVQYSRRNTMVVSGLEFSDSETQYKLETNICNILSESGVEVKPSDLNHGHRNGKKGRVIKNKNGSRTFPPSITVVFDKSSKKDKVLRSYSNYDSATKKKKR